MFYKSLVFFVRNILLLQSKTRSVFWSFFMKQVGDGVQIGAHSYITCPRCISLHDDVIIGSYSEITNFNGAHLEIGENTQLGGHLEIIIGGDIFIGSNVLVGPGCKFISFSHTFDDRKKPIMSQGIHCRGISIHDDVWIGANVVVLDGVTVGKGSVIAAGAVVTKNGAPNSIMGGVPAVLIRKRGAKKRLRLFHGNKGTARAIH